VGANSGRPPESSMESILLSLALFTLVLMRSPNIFSKKSCTSICVPREDRVEIREMSRTKLEYRFFSVESFLSKCHEPHLIITISQMPWYHIWILSSTNFPNITNSIVTNSVMKFDQFCHVNITSSIFWISRTLSFKYHELSGLCWSEINYKDVYW